MSYQSIIVHACDSPTSAASYELATHIALAEGAHLTGIAFSGARDFIYRTGAAASIVPLGPGDLAFLTEAAERDLRTFNDALAPMHITCLHGRISETSAEHGLPLEARFADLLVIGQECTPTGLVESRHSVARTILVHAPCPVLVVPRDYRTKQTPQNVLIGWDGSMEASRAVRASLPLLKYAASITVICYAPPKFAVEDDKPGDALAMYLSCHGMETHVVHAPHSADVGDSLLALARERACDLLIMGCFGHSRLREIVLGGATERVLAASTIPLLMCH